MSFTDTLNICFEVIRIMLIEKNLLAEYGKCIIAATLLSFRLDLAD